MDSSRPELSVVIPVGPGEKRTRALLERLSPLPASYQVVLSTCRSDPPPEFGPEAASARIVSGPAGRAAQLNRGVAAASAERLWIVHADSMPDETALGVAAAFARAPLEHDRIGWFRLRYAADGPAAAQLNARAANLRSRLLGLPFGDQAWLLSRQLFDRIGGFDERFGRGEDLDFIVRARAAGARLQGVDAEILSSARRYRRSGWLRTSVANAWLTLALWRRSRERTRRLQATRPSE